MKLYYAPGACSLSPHIVLREAGLDFELVRVDLSTKKTASGADYRRINPKGYVPALQLDDSEVLTEGVAIVQFLADRHPGQLAPPPGTLARARVQEHLNFVSAELHKSFSPLFSSGSSESAKRDAKVAVALRFDWLESHFADGRGYLLGEQFSVADAYLFTVARWAVPTGIGLERWPHVGAFVARVGERGTVKEALRAEAA